MAQVSRSAFQQQFLMSAVSQKLTQSAPSAQQESTVIITPKKRPRYLGQQSRSSRKIKSISKCVEKESANLFYSLLTFIWALTVAGVIFMAFQAKLSQVSAAAVQEIDQCRVDYQNNRCDNPLPSIRSYCNEKLMCSNSHEKELANRRVSYSKLFGQIMYEFANGAGVIGLVLGCFLIWLCIKQKGKQKTIISMQYYQDN